MIYWFDVHTGNKPWQEQGEFTTQHHAFSYFTTLLSHLTPPGYAYLSQWGAGEFPADRVFGCRTDNPAKVIGQGEDNAK